MHTHLFYDEIYYTNSTSVCNGAFPIVTGVGGVFYLYLRSRQVYACIMTLVFS